MADYFSVLSNAVAALGPAAADERRALYDRARKALSDRLRAAQPPISEAEIELERSALEAAIRRTESAAMGQAAGYRFAPADDFEPHPIDSHSDERLLGKKSLMFHLMAGLVASVAVAILLVIAYGLSTRKQLASTPKEAPRKEAPRPVNYVYLQQVVYYRTTHPVGTIIVDKAQHFLYLVRPNVAATRYGIGNGPECANAAGLYQILRKEIVPEALTSSTQAAQRVVLADANQPDRRVASHVLRFGAEYRFHAVDPANNVGQAVRSGCFRLIDSDISGLYDRVPVQTRVVVMN